MDLSKLSTGDKVMAGSGIALFLFSFLTWFNYGGYGSVNGWHFFVTGTIPTLIAMILVGYVVATKLSDVKLPDLPAPEALIVLGLAALAALLVILRLLIGYKIDVPFGGSVKLDRAFGLILATLAAIGMAGGAFLKFQEEGGELPGKTGGGTGSTDGGSPTPF